MALRLAELASLGRPGGREPSANPFIQSEALLESQLVLASVDQLRSTAALAFDLRTALGLDEGNTAVLYVEGVATLEWHLEEGALERSARAYTAWNVVEQTATREGPYLTFTLYFVPDARLKVRFRRGAFHVANIIGLPLAPPAFARSDPEVVARGMPGWDSPIDARYWTVRSARQDSE